MEIDILDAATSVFTDDSTKEAKQRAIRQHTLGRLNISTRLFPDNLAGKSVLDFGFSDYWIGIYRQLGCTSFTGITKAPPTVAGQVAPLDMLNLQGIECDLVYADIDSDSVPLDDESVDVVCCFEILEHLATDPMRMVSEANRILKENGVFLLSTPNIASAFSFYRLLRGRNPNYWCSYSPDPIASSYRHKREYTAREIESLFRDGGFSLDNLFTKNVHSLGLKRKLLYASIYPLLWVTRLGNAHPGTHIFALGRKSGPVLNRHPSWLYTDFTFSGK